MTAVPARIYELYGLRIRSEIPLPARAAAGEADLAVAWGESVLPNRPSPGRVLARLRLGTAGGYTHVATESGYDLVYHDVCTIRVACDCTSLRVHVLPEGPAEMVPLLVAGNALAFVLTLLGEGVLHASAVELDGAAIAFVGGSGMGKSTLAALCCGAGAGLVTDDVVRLDTGRAPPACHVGGLEIRLRPNAAPLLDGLGESDCARAVDGRITLRLASPPRGPVPLAAVVIPRPSRVARHLAVRRLGSTEALFALMRHTRVTGLLAPELMRSQFERFAQVARCVPVLEADIPWGPPFDPALPAELLSAMGLRPEPVEVA